MQPKSDEWSGNNGLANENSAANESMKGNATGDPSAEPDSNEVAQEPAEQAPPDLEDDVVKRKFFVGGYCSEEDLRQYFSKFGPLESVEPVKEPGTGRVRGFGFITCKFQETKEAALKEKEHFINGKKVSVRSYEGSTHGNVPSTVFKRKIFVGGIDYGLNDEVLYDYFSKFGELEFAHVQRDQESRLSRGFGFVLFKTEEACKECLKRRIHFVTSKDRVEVKLAEPRTQRGQGASYMGRGAFMPMGAGMPGGYRQSPMGGRPMARHGYMPSGAGMMAGPHSGPPSAHVGGHAGYGQLPLDGRDWTGVGSWNGTEWAYSDPMQEYSVRGYDVGGRGGPAAWGGTPYGHHSGHYGGSAAMGYGTPAASTYMPAQATAASSNYRGAGVTAGGYEATRPSNATYYEAGRGQWSHHASQYVHPGTAPGRRGAGVMGVGAGAVAVSQAPNATSHAGYGGAAAGVDGGHSSAAAAAAAAMYGEMAAGNVAYGPTRMRNGNGKHRLDDAAY